MMHVFQMGQAMIHPTLLMAAILCLAISIIHSWLGEQRLIGPMLQPSMHIGVLKHRFARKLVRFVWHVSSLAWTGIGLVLAALAFLPLEASGFWMLAITGATFAVIGVLALWVGRGRHHAWIGFLAIAGLCAFPLI